MAIRCGLFFFLLLLAGCASAPVRSNDTPLPQLKLSPESFHGSVSLVQRLLFARLDGQAAPNQAIEVLLEIEPTALRLAGFAIGQRMLTIEWDGQRLHAERHPHLPKLVDENRVVRDVQLTYWPAEAIRAALPADWSLNDSAEQRTLQHNGHPTMIVQYSADPHWSGRAELENRVEGYRLTIDSQVAGE